MFKVTGLLFGLLLTGLMIPSDSFAETKRKKPVFQSRKNLREIDMKLPSSLNFRQRNVERDSNAKVAEDFLDLGAMISDERFVSGNYLEVFIVHLTIAEPMSKKKAKTLAATTSIPNHEILEKGIFEFGNRGLWWKTRQRFPSVSYIKYISIFSNKFQTDVVAAVYTERFEKSFIPSSMKSIISTSKISNRPF